MLLIQLILFIILIFLLGFFRNHIAAQIQGISLLLFKTRVFGIIFYSIFFLPGVLIHELSHLLVAQLLGVRTGNISIFPQEIKGESVRMGSVQSEQTDPLREILIGSAPFFTGLAIISFIVLFQFGFLLSGIVDIQNLLSQLSFVKIVLLYLIFSIANTMFVSKEDQRGWWFIPLILISIASLFIAFDIKLDLKELSLNFQALIQTINKALILCLILDIFTILNLSLFLSAISSATGRILVKK